MTALTDRPDTPPPVGGAGDGVTAPIHPSAEAPPGAYGRWAVAADGPRVRIGILGRGERGTVLLFPGRTEYVEKYGRTAAEFLARGYGTVTVDWRGQGLADRLLGDAAIGHVGAFTDYQHDVAAMCAVARAEEMPRPWFLVAHSMGGAIGLRALHEGLDVVATAFSAPMWGILIPRALRPIAWSLGWMAGLTRRDTWLTPGTERETYVLTADPRDNMLTSDPDMLAYMRRHLEAIPQINLGGPSLPWLYTTLRECRDLPAFPAPPCPVVTFLPEREAIVDPAAIRLLSARWPDCRLVVVEGGKHETMMETPPRRGVFFDEAVACFERATGRSAPRRLDAL